MTSLGKSSNPTIFDVADRAGVSKSTVSRVLRNESRVSEATREKVLAAAKDLKYTPDATAQRLRMGPGRSVGLLISTVDIPIYARLNRELHEQLHTRAYHVVHELLLQAEPNLIDVQIEHLLGLQIQGLIVSAGSVSDDQLLDVSHRIPTVFVGPPVPELPVHNVAYDYEFAGGVAVDHLYELGHRKIMIQTRDKMGSRGIWMRSNVSATRARQLGMETRMVHVLDIDDYVDFVRESVDAGFTAFVCAFDRLLFQAWRAAEKLGLAVPGDLSLVGCDGVTDGMDILGVTTICEPVRELAQRAVDVLDELIETPHLPSRGTIHELLRGELMTGSTAPPRLA